MKDLSIKQLYRIGQATRKAENAERALNLLNAMTSANWKKLTSTERRQIYRAIADQRDTLRRLNKQCENLQTYSHNYTRLGKRVQSAKHIPTTL